MSFANFSPEWFFGIDIALEFLFAIILLAVALFGLKIYKSTCQRYVKYFSLSFFLIGISYVIQSIFNYLMLSKLNEAICYVMKVQSITSFNLYGMYAHMLFMTIGLVFLVYMTFKIEDKRPLWLLMIISLLAILFSFNKLYTFYLISSVYLIFLVWHFLKNYLKNKTKNSLFIAIAFLFLFFGNVHFLFSMQHDLFYVIGHILELFAYLLILINLLTIKKNEKKERSS
jgi:hypothetical protein